MRSHVKPREFALWLTERAPDFVTVLGPQTRRNVHRWLHESDAPIPFHLADRMMTPLDLHEWEIPDDVWVEPNVCGCGRQIGLKAVLCRRCRDRQNLVDRERKRVARKCWAKAFEGLTPVGGDLWKKEAA